MWHRNIFRMSASRAAELDVSQRALDRCRFFGVPYAAMLLPAYGDEVVRLRFARQPVGCLNQPWSGPVVVWYPDGDWINQGEHNEEV